jgi:hypothetical protein
MKAVNTVLKREEMQLTVSERRKEESESVLGERLASARNIPFVFACIALILSALGLSAQVILSQLPFRQWYWLYSMVKSLPLTGLIVGFLSSSSYLFLSVAARLAGAKEVDEKYPLLTRLGFWSTTAAAAIATAVCALSGVVIFSGVTSVPRLVLDTYYAQKYFNMAALVITGGFPFAWFLSGTFLVAGSNLIGSRKKLQALPAAEAPELPSNSHKPMLVLIEGAKNKANCPVCGCHCEDEAHICDRCHTPHHQECWDYSGGCAIFGCDEKRWQRSATSTDLTVVKDSVEKWINLYQGHWYSLCAAVGGTVIVMGSVTLPVWGYRLPAILKAVTKVAVSLQSIGVLLALGGIIGYILFNILERVSRKDLTSAVNLQEPANGADSRAVVDRLDESTSESSIYSLIFVALGFLLSIAFLFGYLRHAFPYRQWYVSNADALFFLTLGVVFPSALYSACRKRLAYIGSLQNRLAASLKKGEDF